MVCSSTFPESYMSLPTVVDLPWSTCPMKIRFRCSFVLAMLSDLQSALEDGARQGFQRCFINLFFGRLSRNPWAKRRSESSAYRGGRRDNPEHGRPSCREKEIGRASGRGGGEVSGGGGSVKKKTKLG